MRAVFLDRDGVINRGPPYGKSITLEAELELLAGAGTAIQELNRSGFLVVVITNQRGVALGHLTSERLHGIHQKMRWELERAGARLDGIYACTHDEGMCDCRKPGTALFLQASRDFGGIEFTQSFVVGDAWRDIEAGRRLGCRTVLIADTEVSGPVTTADFVAPSLKIAVSRYIAPAADVVAEGSSP